jgi:FAD:protein FMN transferase
MKQSRAVMGMPVTIEIATCKTEITDAIGALFDAAYAYLESIDATFSPYKGDSEVSRINRGELTLARAGAELREILKIAEQTRRETHGYFNVMRGGVLDPSGIVKGWAIRHTAQLLRDGGCSQFYVDAGGDIQTCGGKPDGTPWIIGIQNPFEPGRIVKRIAVAEGGVATSGLYQRGRHIYNPHDFDDALDQVASITVVGPDICDADRYATAAFAMGRSGIDFIASLDGFEGYAITHDRRATMTAGFGAFVAD